MNTAEQSFGGASSLACILAGCIFLVLVACGAPDPKENSSDRAESDVIVFQEPDRIEVSDRSGVVELPTQSFQFDDAVNGVAFLNESNGLAVALNRELLFLETVTGEERWRTRRCQSCSAVHLTRSEDGTEIIMPSRGRDGGAAYDPSSGNKTYDLSGPDYRAALAPDASEILSVLSLEAILEVPGSAAPIWHSNVERIGALGYAPNGEYFVISADDENAPRNGGKALIYNAETRELNTKIEYGHGSFNHLAFSPDGKRLILASYKDRVMVWDVAKNAALCRFNSDDNGQGLRAFQLSPDGSLIATAGGTDNWGYVRVWETQTCQLQAESTFSDRVGSLSFHPNQPLLSAGSWSGEVAIYDISSIEP